MSNIMGQRLYYIINYSDLCPHHALTCILWIFQGYNTASNSRAGVGNLCLMWHTKQFPMVHNGK